MRSGVAMDDRARDEAKKTTGKQPWVDPKITILRVEETGVKARPAPEPDETEKGAS